jgi:hypothetical protein
VITGFQVLNTADLFREVKHFAWIDGSHQPGPCTAASCRFFAGPSPKEVSCGKGRLCPRNQSQGRYQPRQVGIFFENIINTLIVNGIQINSMHWGLPVVSRLIRKVPPTPR